MKNKYSIEAGPAPGGYCELAGTYPIGTQVTVKETVPKGVYATIQVQPPGNGGHITASSIIATIGDGITEVDFTDTTQKPGTATLTPKNANFGKLKRGTQGKPKVFTLTNTGGTTINISSVALGGANPTDFFIVSNSCGATLAANSTCTIQVSFSPSGAGAFTAQLIVTDNASDSPQISTLTGTGV
ncbi:MAG: choice-of-anchor D domain-containing protein [Terriglobales bacterium]